MSNYKQIEIYQFNSRSNYWLVRADGGKFYEDFKYNHFISIHHNEVGLNDLSTDELLFTAEKTIEYYKKQINDIYQDRNLSKHQITFTAKRLYSFIEEMDVGDYVIVPSFKSNYFLIGQIISDVYEDPEAERIKLTHGYERSRDIKRRKVKWINEIPRYKVNPKFLYSTLTVHHTISNITELSKYVDGLISPIFFKDGKLNLWLRVNTPKGISSASWKDFYVVIDDVKNPVINEDIIATSNVESPGYITLQSIGQFFSTNHGMFSSGLISLAILFGKVSIKGVEINGILPAYRQYKINKLEFRERSIDVEQKEKDVELQDLKRYLEIEKTRKELRAIREMEISVDVPNVYYENADQMQMDSDGLTDGDLSL